MILLELQFLGPRLVGEEEVSWLLVATRGSQGWAEYGGCVYVISHYPPPGQS